MWQWIQEGQIWSEVFLQLPVSHCICHPDGNLFQRDGKTLIYTTFRGLWFSFEVTWELAQFKAKAIFPQNVWQTRELLISLNLLKGTLTLHEYHLLLLSCRFKEQELAGQKSWDVVHVQAESSAEGNRLQLTVNFHTVHKKTTHIWDYFPQNVEMWKHRKTQQFPNPFFFFPGKKYFPLFLNSLVSFISHFKYYFAVISTGNLKANWLCWVSVFLYSCMNKEFKACLVASCTPFSLVCPTRAAKLCCIACV